jgi:predicted phage terminase large subunit-like protein
MLSVSSATLEAVERYTAQPTNERTLMDLALNALLKRDFLSFARKAILGLEGTKIGEQRYLKYLADELDQFAKEETRRLLINLPPGHLKTLLGSVCMPAWLLAHDPSLKIIIVTHAERLSKTIARNIRSTLQSGWFKQVFATRVKKGHAAVTDFGISAGGGVFRGSFRGGLTGHRADVIIVDDPHDIGDPLEQIVGTIETFNTTLMSRLNRRNTGRVLVVAHRVHERDLSSSLLRTKKWKHVVLPMEATLEQTYESASGKWRRRKGDLLRPDAFDPKDLDELRVNSFNPDFNMLYQQNCDLLGLPAISADHFPTMTELMPPDAPVVLSVDAGVAGRPRSAFSVIQAWRLGADRYYLLDLFREQCDYADLLDNVRRFRKVYRPVAILIERAANGHALISDLRRRYPKLGKLVIPVDPDGRSKSARLRVHVETIIAKRIHLPADVSWRDDFVDEFVEFPHGEFSDQVDATTQFLDHVGKLAGLTTSPRAGMASGVMNSAGQMRTISPSIAREPGRGAGVHSDGRPFTSRRSSVTFLPLKMKVR